MKAKAFLFILTAVFAMVWAHQTASAANIDEVVDRFCREGKLNAQECAEAREAARRVAATPPGPARRAAATDLLRKAAKKYPDALLRYKKRAAQAEFLLRDDPAAADVCEGRFRHRLGGSEVLALPTSMKFLSLRIYAVNTVNRAIRL